MLESNEALFIGTNYIKDFVFKINYNHKLRTLRLYQVSPFEGFNPKNQQYFQFNGRIYLLEGSMNQGLSYQRKYTFEVLRICS